MSSPTILAFAGRIRNSSFNKRLVRVAAHAAEQYGADVSFADLNDYQLPLYCGDWHDEHGIPENALAFKELMKSHNGFLIASPEYNGSLTGILKNTIDWATIQHGEEERLACFHGKVAGIMCAAPGVGGSHGLHHLRAILSRIGTFVLPKHVNVTNCHAHLHDQNVIEDNSIQQQVASLSKELVRVVEQLH